MKVRQFYEKCLSQASYFISSNGEAVVIDPLRDIDAYLEFAKNEDVLIKYIFETHFHADFVSGHLELAAKTGAVIVFGPEARTGFESYQGTDGELFTFGDASIELLHTPGHTLESCCYLLMDGPEGEINLFTGDTLFLGDVGRPDLAQDTSEQLTKEILAGMLYDSLRGKIMPLPDKTVIYPGHGAGSACGKNLSNERFSDLGTQKRSNYALAEDLGRQEFIAELCDNLSNPPAYFPLNVKYNSSGYELLENSFKKSMAPLAAEDFRWLLDSRDICVLDTRSPEEFAQGHIEGSVNIGLDGAFAPWVGALIPGEDTEILYISEKGRERETVFRLARIGFHHCLGYLEGGMDEWKSKGYDVERIEMIDAGMFMEKLQERDCTVIDVRSRTEYSSGYVEGALNLPLDLAIPTEVHKMTIGDPVYVYCAGGYRSMIFISRAKRVSGCRFINVNGGFGAIRSILH